MTFAAIKSMAIVLLAAPAFAQAARGRGFEIRTLSARADHRPGVGRCPSRQAATLCAAIRVAGPCYDAERRAVAVRPDDGAPGSGASGSSTSAGGACRLSS
jgi:hypothetical protein